MSFILIRAHTKTDLPGLVISPSKDRYSLDGRQTVFGVVSMPKLSLESLLYFVGKIVLGITFPGKIAIKSDQL